MNIPIVYEDDWLLILDKPAGLLSVPAGQKASRNLTGILNRELKKEPGLNFYPCHRLDRETSGLIIYAKSKAARDRMTALFKQRQVKKTYLALVQGRLDPREGKIQTPIEGQSALTGFRVLEQRKDFAVVEVSPETGRTNQIRIHFKKIGHPLVGETKFAFRKDYALRHKRLCLHARALEFVHPRSGQLLRLEVGLPSDLEKFLAGHP